MNKKITTKEIELIMKAIMDCNVPVKVYAGLQDLFNKLPVIEDKEVKTK